MKPRAPKLRQAERDVKQSTEAFEDAVDRLEEKIGDTTRRIREAADLASLPAQFLTSFLGERVARQLRKHPKAFALGGLAAGALVLLELRLRRTQKAPGAGIRLVSVSHSNLKH